jgi:hypothetical protein
MACLLGYGSVVKSTSLFTITHVCKGQASHFLWAAIMSKLLGEQQKKDPPAIFWLISLSAQ